ncbi:uncharacterized protein LOC123611967 isoform X2 [Camelus bactrianus]|uniref:Uncharacterized protein LOC123611967 isoform X2 n=1 Tax=Camelus bactrianus TaxID=9837 RepID=A0AC58NUT9_CAMBA
MLGSAVKNKVLSCLRTKRAACCRGRSSRSPRARSPGAEGTSPGTTAAALPGALENTSCVQRPQGIPRDLEALCQDRGQRPNTLSLLCPRLQYQSPADSATQTPDHALSSGGWKPTVKFPVGLFLVPQRPGRSSVPYGHSFQSKSDYGQPGGQALKPCGVRLSMCVPEGPQEPLEAVTSPSPWSSAPGKERFCCRSDPRGSTSQRPCRWRSGLRDSGRGPGSA